MCVVQLPRASQFAVPPDGGVETAEMGERGCEGEAVQHLNREARGGEERGQEEVRRGEERRRGAGGGKGGGKGRVWQTQVGPHPSVCPTVWGLAVPGTHPP